MLGKEYDRSAILQRVTKGVVLTALLFSILFFLLLFIFLFFQRQILSVQHVLPLSIKTREYHISTPTPAFSPLDIAILRNRVYPGSKFHFLQTLTDGLNYHQYIVSYQSDGLDIHALLTVPSIQKPPSGFPAILFNHGYIPPSDYQTAPESGQYSSYIASLASQGYIVLKPDYRGNGLSQGEPAQIYISPGYVIDDLNALASLEKYAAVNPKRIGIWGHSMGGLITLYDLVLTKNVKSAVIWSGVVGSYPEILTWWSHRVNITGNDLATEQTLRKIILQVGSPSAHTSYWNAIDPSNFLQDITVPIQLHVGLSDQVVPPDFSINFARRLLDRGKSVQLYEYPGNDHNISQSFETAMQRTIAFFDTTLKK